MSSSSYLGHGAKYWADKYYELQTQTRLPDDPADLSWREKYLALEKECAHYQATLSDMRVEIEDLRSKSASSVPVSDHETEKWRNAYWKLCETLKKKEAQCDALSVENLRISRNLQTLPKRHDTYRGKPAEQWAELYLSEQFANQQNRSKVQTLSAALEQKDHDVTHTPSPVLVACPPPSVVDGHDAAYWNQKYTSLKKESASSSSRRAFLAFVIFFFSFALGASFGHSVGTSSSASRSSSKKDEFSPKVQPKTGTLFSNSDQPDLAPFIVRADTSNYYIRLCQGNRVISSYYVRAGETLSTNIPLGKYTVYYAYSPSYSTWFGEHYLWDTSTIYYKFLNTFVVYDYNNQYHGLSINYEHLSSNYRCLPISVADWRFLS